MPRGRAHPFALSKVGPPQKERHRAILRRVFFAGLLFDREVPLVEGSEAGFLASLARAEMIDQRSHRNRARHRAPVGVAEEIDDISSQVPIANLPRKCQRHLSFLLESPRIRQPAEFPVDMARLEHSVAIGVADLQASAREFAERHKSHAEGSLGSLLPSTRLPLFLGKNPLRERPKYFIVHIKHRLVELIVRPEQKL